jgi:hypothetical protein
MCIDLVSNQFQPGNIPVPSMEIEASSPTKTLISKHTKKHVRFDFDNTTINGDRGYKDSFIETHQEASAV